MQKLNILIPREFLLGNGRLMHGFTYSYKEIENRICEMVVCRKATILEFYSAILGSTRILAQIETDEDEILFKLRTGLTIVKEQDDTI